MKRSGFVTPYLALLGLVILSLVVALTSAALAALRFERRGLLESQCDQVLISTRAWIERNAANIEMDEITLDLTGLAPSGAAATLRITPCADDSQRLAVVLQMRSGSESAWRSVSLPRPSAPVRTSEPAMP